MISNRRRVQCSLRLIGMAALLATAGIQADVILDPPNLTGTVGMNGETFGSANINAYWSGGNSQTQLTNADNDFAIRVQPGVPFNLSVTMFSFQGTSGAYLSQTTSNLAAISADTVRTVDLTRDAGRVRGSINVNGGSVQRVDMQTYASPASNEAYSGNVTVTTAPFNALQPFPSGPNVRVRGTAILRAAAGCDVPVSLADRYLSVPLAGIVDATWSFDLSAEQCDLGSIQGNVTLSGLGGMNADVTLNRHYVRASGPVSRLVSLTADGGFSFASLPDGSYYTYLQSMFNAPYGYINFNGSNASVTAGQITTRDFLRSVGTLHGDLQVSGTWDAGDTYSIQVAVRTLDTSEYAYDAVDLTSGDFDLVVPAGQQQLYYIIPGFYTNNGGRYTYQWHYAYYFQPQSSPFAASVTEGDSVHVGTLAIQSSEAEQVFQLANPGVGIKRLRIQGNQYIRDPVTNVLLGQKQISLDSNLSGGQPTNAVQVLIRGEPGTYQLVATADGDDGGTYSAPFELVLGQPQNTPVGTNVEQDFATDSGESIGSVTFGTVSIGGDTTISLSSVGPQAPANFRVFGGGLSLYYDIRSTAAFDEALVCLDYDDSEFAGNESREANLELAHYVCTDEANSVCNWETITAFGYPDTVNNRICGVTSSFSIFSILEPLDQDDDGVADEVDNCPQTSNTEQEDLDGDGFGDACDNDIDGDGIVDDEDTCPLVADSNNNDLDGDGFGDVCDLDDDNDGYADQSDNCPANGNPGQADFDGDGAGDACDLDDDNDSVEDSSDDCPGTSLDASIDATGCSSSQLFAQTCPIEAEYKSHGRYVSCVANEAERQLAIGLISIDEKDAAVSAAAQSEIGQK